MASLRLLKLLAVLFSIKIKGLAIFFVSLFLKLHNYNDNYNDKIFMVLW